MADAPRCNVLCSALRWPLHRTASYRAPHRSLLSRGAWEAVSSYCTSPCRSKSFFQKRVRQAEAMLLDGKSIGLNTSFQFPQKESSSDCQKPHKVLRKNPHPTVRDLTKHSERNSIRLSETSQRTPKESSFICRRTPCVLRRKLHFPALFRRVSACCSLYRSTRGC